MDNTLVSLSIQIWLDFVFFAPTSEQGGLANRLPADHKERPCYFFEKTVNRAFGPQMRNICPHLLGKYSTQSLIKIPKVPLPFKLFTFQPVSFASRLTSSEIPLKCHATLDQGLGHTHQAIFVQSGRTCLLTYSKAVGASLRRRKVP